MTENGLSGGKTAQRPRSIGRMFSGISHDYDRLNRILSLGRDFAWRVHAARLAALPEKATILDVCSGTGDFAIALSRQYPRGRITGIDISPGMIAVGNSKLGNFGLAGRALIRTGDAQQLPFADNEFDAVTVGFGLRNIHDRPRALAEMFRVLKPGGRLVVLEFSHPEGGVVEHGYRAYLRTFLPLAARLFGADVQAYRYLAASIRAFPGASELAGWLRDAHFENVTWRRRMGGAVAIHLATKP